MKISVLGCGRWGSFIAWYCNHIGHDVTLWGRKGSSHLTELEKTRGNTYVTLDEKIVLTDALQKAVDAPFLIISVSSQSLRSFCTQLDAYDLSGKTLLLCMKGLEEESGKRLTQIVEEIIRSPLQLAVWVGPGHVQELIVGIPNCMVIDSHYEDTKHTLINALSSNLIRFYFGEDLIGTEIGAAAKNVIGIAAGMLDGLHLTSLKGALMSRGTREISRLIAKMGGDELTAYGLCHLGDYEATLFSAHSHNRQYGEAFVQGLPFDSLAEGVSTTKALCLLGKQYDVDMPICRTVYS
ncbi:MAG TPA: glycerol-3-phosphate dehydrogenase, partial [Clostridiales bacterium]|nr:glycerol-3-phosphate dehydrogenase [Clostridiales bacterium]